MFIWISHKCCEFSVIYSVLFLSSAGAALSYSNIEIVSDMRSTANQLGWFLSDLGFERGCGRQRSLLLLSLHSLFIS